MSTRRPKRFIGGTGVKLTQDQAGYIGPEISIRCGTCHSYRDKFEPTSPCQLVGGIVDSLGCCNLWNTDGRFSNKFIGGREAVKILFE